MPAIQPFSVSISDLQLNDLKQRLSLTRFPEQEAVDDWSQGMPLAYTKELVDYWQNDYDMKRLETRLNSLPQFTASIDGHDIHFIHVKSSHADAKPLILTHGWPGSVVEFLKVISPLTEPTQHGGSAEDAFHVVIPSLIGYGFSSKPSKHGMSVQAMGGIWAKLMRTLSYDKYFAQGGDWGSAVTSALAQQDPNCIAIHLNLVASPPIPEQLQNLTEEEGQYLAAMQYYQDWDSGYSKIQSTRPQTIGYSLVDSPVGLLTWIIEKFWSWTDCDGHPENALSKDEMLDNVMVYWLNAAGASSARLYWESVGTFVDGVVNTPTGISLFPKEIFGGTQAWAENIYKNIQYFNTKVAKGGHFAAFEQPDIFVSEVRSYFANFNR